MANYLEAFYFLIDNDEFSEYQNFDDFSKNLKESVEYFHVQSRNAWFSYALSKLLHASGQEGELKFLTEARNYDELSLITSDLFEKIISEINKLILWCRNNPSEVSVILKYNCEPHIILEAINNIKVFTDELNSWGGERLDILFAYLKKIIEFIHQAENKQQFIIYITNM
ncbi:hypothetical protein QSV37_12490 [Acinetobacter sp. VNK23]|uniref:hypothetical protein n=1 Tax=Acinetobacter thutiue TaxID=2998078 RepID=UPI002576F75A|nr:hypothetical protein [Acinetobacter thutiue]MDM1021112.1 hypothetical protein [Acinetobacter thutiue]